MHLFLKHDRNEDKIQNQLKLREPTVIAAIVVMSFFRSSKLYNVALQDCSVIQRRCLLPLVFCLLTLVSPNILEEDPPKSWDGKMFFTRVKFLLECKCF